MSNSLRSLYIRFKTRPVFVYTVLFLIISVILFGKIYVLGLTFINKGDGFQQYIRWMIFFSDYFKGIIKGLIHDYTLNIPEWSFAIGEGADIFTVLPLSPIYFLSLFFNHSNMYICFDLIQLIRLYLCGLAFILYCRETLPTPPTVIRLVTSALLFSFSHWTLSEITFDPMYIRFALFIPLLTTGIERIIHKKKPLIFILSVMLNAICSVYILFICGMLAAGYAMLRLMFLYRTDFRSYISPILRLILSALLGIMLAAFAVLPTVYILNANPRTGLSLFKYSSFYYPNFWEAQPTAFLSLMSAVALVPLFMIFFIRGKYRLLKISIVLLFIMTLTKFTGSILNGFNYSNTRWYFVFSFIFSYLVCYTWNDLTSSLNNIALKISLCILVYLLLCVLFEESRIELAFIYFSIASILLLLLTNSSKRHRERILFLFSILSIIISNFYLRNGKYDELYRKDRLYNDLYRNESYAISALKASSTPDATDPLQRYSGSDLSNNSGFLGDLSSSSFYWSNISPYTIMFRENIALFQPRTHIYNNYDERTVANAISDIKYYISNNERVPYGFSFAGSVNVNEEIQEQHINELKQELGTFELTEYQENSIRSNFEKYIYVFKNDYPLPLGFTYDSYIPYEDYLKMSPPNREWVMLDSVALDGFNDSEIKHDTDRFLNEETLVPSRITDVSPEMIQSGNTFTAPIGGSINLSFEKVNNSEMYLYLEGVTFKEIDEYNKYFGDDSLYDPLHYFNRTGFNLLSFEDRRDIIKKHFTREPRKEVDINVITPDDRRTSVKYKSEYRLDIEDKRNFVINLGYRDEQINEAEILSPVQNMICTGNADKYRDYNN